MTGEDTTQREPRSSRTDDTPDRGSTVTPDRRRLLRLMGGASIMALAGCTESGEEGHGEIEARDPGWCVEENNVEVPEAFRTAESIDGIQRNPDDMNTRSEAAYQCHPQGYQLCANCRFFIPAKPAEVGDGIGACAIVEGRIRSQDWCALYRESERLAEFPNPEPLEEAGIQPPPETRE